MRIIAASPKMQEIFRLVTTLSEKTHPVLIEGESGTGKELVARAIHTTGRQNVRPFVVVDCGAIVPTLIESELFGHVRGAFTGALQSRTGLLVAAGDGTIFLDEVDELPPPLQPKLLRALQEREVRPVGGSHAVPIHARILAATKKDLALAAQQGAFRKDLFFRLNVVHLRIPPLRERQEDIPLLVTHFLEKLARDQGVQRSISDEALRAMSEHTWPGNIRELEHCLEHASVMATCPMLRLADLPASVTVPQPTTCPGGSPDSEIVPIAELQRRAVLAALDRANGDKLEAARLLGIGKTTLYRKLRGWSYIDRSKGNS